MAATSVTGTGQGEAGKRTAGELASLAVGPSIIFSGIIEGEETPSSPPSSAFNTVVFPYELAGGANAYVVMLTTISGGAAYVVDKDEDDGNFIGFTFSVEQNSEVMYLVAKVGVRPNL